MTRVAVVGAGAVGGFIAAALAKAGVSVAVVARGEHLASIRREGLRVESDLGAFSVQVDAGDDLRLLGDFDVLLLTFKAHQWPGMLTQLEPFAATTTLVTMHNGLPFWYVREPPLESVDPEGRIGRLVGDDRVIGSVVHLSGEIAAPGLIRQTGGLRFVVGEPGGGPSARLEMLAALFRRAGLLVEIDPNIRATVWLKLVNNSGLNPVSVLRGMTIRSMLANSDARKQVYELMTEALHVGQTMGIVAGVDVDARIDYAAQLADVKTSMLQDYERGRPLELDPILGAVIELAERHQVEVPRLRDVYAQLRSISR